MSPIFWLPLCWMALQAAPALEQAVRAFWDALEARDKVEAMQWVHPEDLNKFLNRHEPGFEGWELERITPLSDTEASVAVRFRRQFPQGSTLLVRARETWQRTEAGWKVRIQSLEDYYERLEQHRDRPARLPPRLEVLPRTIKFYAHSDQPGVIIIRNGLQSAVQVVGLELDEQRFRISKSLDEVGPRSVGRIALRYVGKDAQPDQASSVLLRLKVAAELREFELPVICNYSDPMLQWLRRQKLPQPTNPPPRERR